MYVRASAQAKIIKTIFDELDEKEQAACETGQEPEICNESEECRPGDL